MAVIISFPFGHLRYCWVFGRIVRVVLGSLSRFHLVLDGIVRSFGVFKVKTEFHNFGAKFTRTRILLVVGGISGSLLCFRFGLLGHSYGS